MDPFMFLQSNETSWEDFSCLPLFRELIYEQPLLFFFLRKKIFKRQLS